jgi:hypothetical protein
VGYRIATGDAVAEESRAGIGDAERSWHVSGWPVVYGVTFGVLIAQRIDGVPAGVGPLPTPPLTNEPFVMVISLPYSGSLGILQMGDPTGDTAGG